MIDRVLRRHQRALVRLQIESHASDRVRGVVRRQGCERGRIRTLIENAVLHHRVRLSIGRRRGDVVHRIRQRRIGRIRRAAKAIVGADRRVWRMVGSRGDDGDGVLGRGLKPCMSFRWAQFVGETGRSK